LVVVAPTLDVDVDVDVDLDGDGDGDGDRDGAMERIKTSLTLCGTGRC
jgi:hypothetical protein